MTLGIYCIENIINNKKYIGSSDDIEERWIHHKSKLKNNNHYNTHLQFSYNKYGSNNFLYYILEECPLNDLEIKEDYYIEKFNTTNDLYGYNKNGLLEEI